MLATVSVAAAVTWILATASVAGVGFTTPSAGLFLAPMGVIKDTRNFVILVLSLVVLGLRWRSCSGDAPRRADAHGGAEEVLAAAEARILELTGQLECASARARLQHPDGPRRKESVRAPQRGGKARLRRVTSLAVGNKEVSHGTSAKSSEIARVKRPSQPKAAGRPEGPTGVG